VSAVFGVEGEEAMSSTNRGRARNTLDQYETPWEAVAPLLPFLPRARVILDPCCGTGAMVVRAAQALGALPLGIEVDGTRPFVDGMTTVQVADALTVSWPASDLILTNPPYAFAMEFVLRGVREAKRGTTVAMLLRLAFLASQARHAFHAAQPADVFVLSKRPSFTGGGSDSADYAWFVWGPGRGGRWNVLAPPAPDPGPTLPGL
jgi:hypothetical protein